MKTKLILIATIVLAVTVSLSVDGKRVKLRPLSAREVYQVLRAEGREDAVPQGRVITQGLAAIKGFALGITKGVGGSLLFDLATANATTDFLNNLNYSALVPDFSAINFTALLPPYNLTALFGPKGGNFTNGTITFSQQEICFNSRSLNGISDDGELVEDQARQIATPIPPSTSAPTTVNPTAPTGPPPGTTPTISTPTGTSPTTSAPTTTAPTTGTTTPTGTTPTTTSTPTTSSPTGTTPTTTATSTTEQTPPGTTNCIVLQKPIAVVQKPTGTRRRRGLGYSLNLVPK